jgi:mRNA interferase MazF
VAHTTSLRGTIFEVAAQSRFLKAGAFDAQNLLTIPYAKLIRKLGNLPPDQIARIEEAVRRWLAL